MLRGECLGDEDGQLNDDDIVPFVVVVFLTRMEVVEFLPGMSTLGV